MPIPSSVIADDDGLPFGFHRRLDRAPVRRVLDGVLVEVAQHLLQQIWVCVGGRQVGGDIDDEGMRWAARVNLAADAHDEGCQQYRFEGRSETPGHDVGQRQEIAQQPVEAFALGDHVV